MTYHEEEQTRLRRQASKQAIALAMQGRWREAVEANKSLIENFPNDVDAYNRLGRAYMELGEYTLARESYEKSLKIDSYNTIAQKNLNRLTLLGEAAVGSDSDSYKVEPQQFIEEVGKAGVVDLHRLAPPAILARAATGSRVNLRIDGPRLVVEDSRGEYLGRVEPKHGQRLIKLMQGGNRYSAAIISSTEEAVTVIIRETYQHPSQVEQSSFPSRGPESYRPYIGDRIGDRVIRRKLEYEAALPVETGYAIVGEEDMELISDDSEELDEEDEEEIDSDD
ncbi:tetratricopeptide repeat protein [Chloroflexota bacterium]